VAVTPGCSSHVPAGKSAQARQPAATPAGAAADDLFIDTARSAGLDYAWSVPGKRPLNILQTIGNGCAFLDYDRDGNLDALLVGPRVSLYRGDGQGRFTNVSDQTGVSALSGNFLGCAVGDFDNDGFDDIYLTAYRGGALLHNESGSRFRDATRESNVPAQPWATSAVFTDIDNDGRLDLYVCNYVDFGPTTDPQLCRAGDLMTSCGPRYYKPIRGSLYRNEGGGRFRDITQSSGASQVEGRALGVAAADVGGPGKPWLAIANDELQGDLLCPSGSGPNLRLANNAQVAGTGLDRDGNIHGGMGTDWGDYDNDGRLDLFVGTFSGEAKTLYHNDGDGIFSEVSEACGLGTAMRSDVTFGCKFVDIDNDGWLDLITANGHVQDNIDQIKQLPYRQATRVFHNRGDGKFDDITARAGRDVLRPIVGRGLAAGDFDNDGRVDVLIVDSEGAPLLLRNIFPSAGHWLGLRLEGAKSNRNGYGAIVTVTVGKRTLVRPCQSGGSYMSASDSRVHVGLGAATKVEKVTVAWPSGRVTTLSAVDIDRYHTVREGDAAPR
jgi:hypothetical protein